MRRLFVIFAVILMACSGDPPRQTAAGSRSTPRVPDLLTTPSGEGTVRVQPRWETVAQLTGAGDGQTQPFRIAERAVQWRLRWRCDSGRIVIGEPVETEPLVDASCPGPNEAYAISTGEVSLAVNASAGWQAVVEQQVDTPVHEPPLPGMAEGQVVATGSFYEIDRHGEGTARLYRLPDQRLALRFEPFKVDNNVDLFVWVSRVPHPTGSKEIVDAPHVVVAPLTSTGGAQNYLLPPEVTPEDVRSVVIWCEPQRFAYVAATMTP